MSTIPPLSESEIRERVGDQSYQRGLGYFRNEAIVNPRCQGNALKALCWGTSDEPYRVTVEFDDGHVGHAECSCPVGHGGFCKHVAAVLLNWRERPNDFVEVEALETALERRTKPELIALINQMLLRDPDLEQLLELPLPKGYPSVPPAQTGAIRRQAAAAFNRFPPGQWGIEGQIADELLNLKAIGDGFATQADVASAAGLYQALAVEVIENYESYPYDEGELGGVIDACLASLADLLGRADEASARQTIFAALVAIFLANVEAAPEYDLSGERALSILLDQATADERRVVAGWIRSARAEATGDVESDDLDDEEADVSSDAYASALFDLEKDTLDDEAFLTAARQAGRVVDLVARLLRLGRVLEAVEATRGVSSYGLPRILECFLEHHQDEVAERIARDRISVAPESMLLDWQRHQYARRGDVTAALAVGERLFKGQPSVPLYAQLREYANQLSCWAATRERLQSALRQQDQWSVLVEVQLDDGDVDRAIAEVTGRIGTSFGDVDRWTLSPALRVAAVAETSRPREAIELYVRGAERLIADRQRGSYHEASRVLDRVRRIYSTLGEADAWQQLIQDLRTRYNRLPALKDELARAGL